MLYCNNAATTYPKPEPVKKAVLAWLDCAPSEAGRTSGAGADLVNDARRTIADFFDIPNPTDLFFSSGATESLNLLVQGLDLSGGHVIASAVEHNSLLRPLYRLKQSGRIDLDIIPCDPTGYVAPRDILAALSDDTRAVFLSHVSNVTGAVQDIAGVCQICNERKILCIIDASQSAGYLPISIGQLKPSAMVITGHKGLFGLPGIGVAYIAPGVSPKPIITGGTGVRSDLLSQPSDRPLIYEAGTLNLPGIAGLSAGVAYVLALGWETIRSTVAGLCNHLLDRLAGHPKIRLIVPSAPASHSAIVSLTIDGTSPGEVGYLLESVFGITVRTGLHCAPLIHQYLHADEGTVRISFSVLNDHKDADAVAQALLQIADTAR